MADFDGIDEREMKINWGERHQAISPRTKYELKILGCVIIFAVGVYLIVHGYSPVNVLFLGAGPFLVVGGSIIFWYIRRRWRLCRGGYRF
jgi:hypothetical protein